VGRILRPKGCRQRPKGERIVVVRENTAFPPWQGLRATPVPVLRDYLTVHYLDNMADYLPKAVRRRHFDFYGKTLNGQAQQLPRATRGVHLLDQRLGHPLGKLYVANIFRRNRRRRSKSSSAIILKAYDADIRTLGWMTEATRQKALDKLHAFTPHVGYPDKWRDYSGLRHFARRSDRRYRAQRCVRMATGSTASTSRSTATNGT
jgi:putative endopeptidase